MTRTNELRREVDQLLARIRRQRQLLTPEVVEQLPPLPRGYIMALLDYGVVCVSPSNHPHYKKYIGNGIFICEYCARTRVGEEIPA
jgi:hypothetical protein